MRFVDDYVLAHLFGPPCIAVQLCQTGMTSGLRAVPSRTAGEDQKR